MSALVQGVPMMHGTDVRSRFEILFRKAALLLKRFSEIAKLCIRSNTQDIAKKMFGYVFKVVSLGNTLKSGELGIAYIQRKNLKRKRTVSCPQRKHLLQPIKRKSMVGHHKAV